MWIVGWRIVFILIRFELINFDWLPKLVDFQNTPNQVAFIPLFTCIHNKCATVEIQLKIWSIKLFIWVDGQQINEGHGRSFLQQPTED